ncbi:glycosyltransferase [Synechococcus elongatus]|uniref:Glycosyltransferase n=1 Tax=Synechococcus elongatus PCC 11802 TaxID=2283154 RepID=A0AAT9JXX9_SYNEL|nr:glycosyltransferase [Synechococcus elongatus]QFZ91821.1 glycosyl transferase [Synechococcus elongatus PCC 11802]
MADPIRIFIGSGEASRIERQVAIDSLRRTSDRPLAITVFNGTHNALEVLGQPPCPAPMSLRVKYWNATEFSLYRFLIPELCGYQGRAIYIDSDVVCLRDIGELFDTDLQGADFLAKAEAYPNRAEALWGLSVVLFDCDRCRFPLEQFIDDLEAGEYSYRDLLCMSPRFLAKHPYQIGGLDPRWNSFDYADRETRLIHYTDLKRQPWKRPGHPYGDLWFKAMQQALESGTLTESEISQAIRRFNVRDDICEGNRPRWLSRRRLRTWLHQIKQQLRPVKV